MFLEQPNLHKLAKQNVLLKTHVVAWAKLVEESILISKQHTHHL